ncbi:MAG: hypoxanthine phosphoribosyltransferase [Alphaproteobacteria bacterium]|nr:hypoxanthine phosphoribosyltransferase [Alphaproteobacteria bacterium]
MSLPMHRLTPLFDVDAIAGRVAALGRELREAHADHPLTVIVVLKGSFVFAADLVRALGDLDVRMEFLGVRSYEGTTSTGQVEITHDLRRSIAGEHCLVVEDIVDTGLTLRFLCDTLRQRDPASLSVATLLDKPSRRKVAFTPDHVGFTIPDAFVVGYGLDLDQRYRHLPYVAVYDPGHPESP